MHLDVPKMDMKVPSMDMKMDGFEKFAKLDTRQFDKSTTRLLRQARSWDMKLEHQSDWLDGRESFTTSPRAPWLQGDVADSLYKNAYELLNRGEWRRCGDDVRAPSRSAFRTRATRRMRCTGRRSRSTALATRTISRRRFGRSRRCARSTRRRRHSPMPRRSRREFAERSRPAAIVTRRRRLLTHDEQQPAAMRSRGPGRAQRGAQGARAERIRSRSRRVVKRVLAKKDACSAPASPHGRLLVRQFRR